jgi:hypothetical protein
MSSTCAREDLASQRIGWFLWGLPAVALAVGAVVGPVARTIVWPAAFLVAGVSCAVNASRCGRMHCYFTGPLYLLAAVATLLVGVGGYRLAGVGLRLPPSAGLFSLTSPSGSAGSIGDMRPSPGMSQMGTGKSADTWLP